MQRIVVDGELCVGHGKCYAIAPDLFAPVDDLGRSQWIADPIGDDDDRRQRGDRAVAGCPEHALSWSAVDPE